MQVQDMPISAIARLKRNTFRGLRIDRFQHMTTRTRVLQTIADIVTAAITIPTIIVNVDILNEVDQSFLRKLNATLLYSIARN